MHCCEHSCFDAQFDAKQAAKDLERLREDGPDPTTRALIAALVASGVEGSSVLDIGGGVGAVHHELLAAGARGATHVDASAAYVEAAREESARRGMADRVRFIHGDFVALAPTIETADIVALDRVICCYHDMETLVAASASRARRMYGAVFPRDRWFLRLGFGIINIWQRIIRRDFRVYLHDPDAIHDAVRRQGLEPAASSRTFVWYVTVFSRRARHGPNVAPETIDSL